MKINDIGYNHKHDKAFCIDRPNGAGDWLLLLVKTKSIFRMDGVDTKFPTDTFVLFTPDCPEYYKADNDIYADDWCHFWPSEEETALLKELHFPLNKAVCIQNITDLSALMRNMCYEHYSTNPYRKRTIDLYFQLLLLKLNERATCSQPPTNITKSVYLEELLNIRESIHRNPGEKWSIDKLAEGISLSRSRFQHLYTQTFGVNILQDIINVRMEQACELLHNTDLPVHEIALRCGYQNAAYFMRRFKDKTGLTPSVFRSSNRPASPFSSFNFY